MRTISPPAELMTEVAGQLLAAAEKLGHRPEVVATTTGAEFGYGFVVPTDVFDEWFLNRGRHILLAPETVAALDEAFLGPQGPEVPFEEEFPVTEVPEDEVPEVPDEKPKRRSRGVAKTTEGEA
jgi:hypothetical protein